MIESMQTSPVARVIISISAMLFAGFAMTRITKRLRLPNVTGYILAGILMGPCCFNLIPQEIISGTDFLSDIALAFIAFSAGEFFKVDVLRRNGAKVIIITVLEACMSSLAVFVLVYGVLHLELSFAIVLSALASATAPASTMMTIRQTGAHGDFVDTLLQVVALDDVVGLILYSMAISVAIASETGSLQLSTVMMPIFANLCVLILGAVFGWILKLFFRKRSTDNRLIVSIAMLFAFCGICAMADVSPLLGCMSMGMTYINLTGDEKLFRQLGYWSPPILLLFFVRSGLNFNLGALTDTLGASGSVPLALVGILYFVGRIIGKYAGSYLGCLFASKSKKVRNNLGLALIPQAGVAIGLAAMGARTLGGETGEMLQTIILASSVLYELVGPACAKLALYLSGSYGENAPESAPAEPDTPKKSGLETLIERMKTIEEHLPAPVESSLEEEIAFTQAAQEQYDLAQYYHNRRFKGGRSTGGLHA